MQNTPGFLQRPVSSPAPVGAGADMDDDEDEFGNQ
jgi:hypothetical protein